MPRRSVGSGSVSPISLTGSTNRLVEEMNAFDPDAATATLKELERRDEDLGQQEKDRYAERDRLQRKREEFESGIGAEAAVQQRRNAEAELVDAARRWAVLKAASVLLGGALSTIALRGATP